MTGRSNGRKRSALRRTRDNVEPLAVSLFATEAWLEGMGWDRPPMVLGLVDGPASDDPSKVLFAYQLVGEGDPYEVLDSVVLTPDVRALVVAVEAWAWPEHVAEQDRIGRPSEHPERVELRSVIALSRIHEVLSVTRPRGGSPTLDEGGDGPLLDAMRRAMFR